jgi:hypothetical protein
MLQGFVESEDAGAKNRERMVTAVTSSTMYDAFFILRNGFLFMRCSKGASVKGKRSRLFIPF